MGIKTDITKITRPVFLCNACFERLGFESSLTMGRVEENCELCGKKVVGECNWVWSNVQKIEKSREEQDKEFHETIGQFASPNCKYCHGTGKEYWIMELQQYKPCDCVLRNVRTLRERGQN
jgi:hypothetical protein